MNKCKSEYSGKIKGKIVFETKRFDEGCMCAVVVATGDSEISQTVQTPAQ